MYLQQMRRFSSLMCGLPFYRKSRQYLESYSLIFHQMSSERREGLRKVWVGDARFVQ
jgi:hypothetical protein